MELLKERINLDGRVAGDGILKVDNFLNHQIDVTLMEAIGKEFYEYFKDREVTKVLTIEASGIAIAAFVAREFGVPLVFAKKSLSKNLDGDLYTAPVTSYTRGKTYTICVAKKFLGSDEKVLLIDDFLANGSALLGLSELVESSGADLVGAGIVIEKTFQPGSTRVREHGLDVYSLARISSIANGKVTFADDEEA